jgi:hypothetical protein
MSTDVEWQNRAACVGMDPNAWFSEGDFHTYDYAREVCVRLCTVRAECLAMALNDPLLTGGMYGGHTPQERRAIRRRARKGGA